MGKSRVGPSGGIGGYLVIYIFDTLVKMYCAPLYLPVLEFSIASSLSVNMRKNVIVSVNKFST